ncbi:MAG: lyase family protein [Alloacidobacterium sp.]|jgi:3-carboxy-cis,cis-muconate cycloisomerase
MSPDGLTSFLFSTPDMANVFSPQAQLRAMTRFEWALSSALEANGLAEAGSAAALEKLLDADFVDLAPLLSDARDAGNIAIPFVRQLTAAVKAHSEIAARSVHLGATSQDVLDSALVLQMKEALQLLDGALTGLDAALMEKVRRYRGTLMLGRTWLQAGPPITLGLKLAGVLAALRRDRQRIRQEEERLLVLQFGGAVGTQASLGSSGGGVSAKVAQFLDLAELELPWHTQRDSLTAIVQLLALVTGTLAKLGRDLALLMQSEVGEVSEGGAEGHGGSSTMPHKHNPVGCAALIAIHAKMPGLSATMLHAMQQEHERGLGLWQAEWDAIPEALRLTSASVSYATEVIDGLKVDSDRMQANLDATHGLPLAEAVSGALASKIGRIEAHQVLHKAVDRAVTEKRLLLDVLKEMPEVKTHLNDVEIDGLLDARNYLGSAQRFISRVLGDDDADN